MSEREAFFKKKLSDLKTELGDCTLVIVSKTRPVDEIKTYYDLGHRDFGENRVQELFDKSELLKKSCPEIRWHMIGHLQKNKISLLLKVHNLFAIHSIDDRQLVEKLISVDKKFQQKVEAYLQVNTSSENEKSGFDNYDELKDCAKSLTTSENLKFVGLMTMGMIRTDHFEEDASRCFKALGQEKEKLQSELNLHLRLSMGMSQDYKIALKEKTNLVRLGTMMFS